MSIRMIENQSIFEEKETEKNNISVENEMHNCENVNLTDPETKKFKIKKFFSNVPLPAKNNFVYDSPLFHNTEIKNNKNNNENFENVSARNRSYIIDSNIKHDDDLKNHSADFYFQHADKEVRKSVISQKELNFVPEIAEFISYGNENDDKSEERNFKKDISQKFIENIKEDEINNEKIEFEKIEYLENTNEYNIKLKHEENINE